MIFIKKEWIFLEILILLYRLNFIIDIEVVPKYDIEILLRILEELSRISYVMPWLHNVRFKVVVIVLLEGGEQLEAESR